MLHLIGIIWIGLMVRWFCLFDFQPLFFVCFLRGDLPGFGSWEWDCLIGFLECGYSVILYAFFKKKKIIFCFSSEKKYWSSNRTCWKTHEFTSFKNEFLMRSHRSVVLNYLGILVLLGPLSLVFLFWENGVWNLSICCLGCKVKFFAEFSLWKQGI